jgi:hypothetical protein
VIGGTDGAAVAVSVNLLMAVVRSTIQAEHVV